MPRIRDSARTAEGVSWQLGTLVGRDEYLRAAADVLLDLFGGDLVGWNAVDARTGRAEARMFPEPHRHTRLDETLADVVDDHPLIVSYLTESSAGVQRPRRLSDVASRADVRRTKAYEQILEPIDADQQLSLLTARLSPTSFHAWGVTRSGTLDFDDDAVALAARLQPLLALLDRLCTLPPPAERSGDAVAEAGLSARETDVLRLLGRGLTAVAMARVLRISEGTVRKHLEHVYTKIGCHDRVLAVQWAQRAGLVDGPTPASRTR